MIKTYHSYKETYSIAVRSTGHLSGSRGSLSTGLGRTLINHPHIHLHPKGSQEVGHSFSDVLQVALPLLLLQLGLFFGLWLCRPGCRLLRLHRLRALWWLSRRLTPTASRRSTVQVPPEVRVHPRPPPVAVPCSPAVAMPWPPATAMPCSPATATMIPSPPPAPPGAAMPWTMVEPPWVVGVRLMDGDHIVVHVEALVLAR